MGESWPVGTLSDLADVNPDRAAAVRGLERFRYIDISCLSESGIASADSIAVIEAQSAPSRAQRLVKSGDSLVGTVRPERGARGLVGAHLDGEVASSGICVLRPKLAEDAGFVYSVVRSPDFTEWCVNHSTGTSYPAVSASSIAKFPLSIPSHEERQRIAEVLSALDDRIESARRLIKSLSDAAQALSATSSDTCSVSDVASTERIQWSPERHQGEIVDHYSLPAFDAGVGPERVEASRIASNKFLVREPRVLFSRLNPDTNRTWLCPPADDVSASVCSTEYAVLVPESVTVGQLWAVLSSGEAGDLLAAATTGTSASHQRVREDAVLAATIADPRALSEQDQAAIDVYVDAVLRQIREVKALREMRDFLLPRLVAGDLRVEAVEELVESET